MADIIYRDLGLGLFEVELVSEAVTAYVKRKLGVDEINPLALVDESELWHVMGAAEEAGFSCAAEDEQDYTIQW